MVFVNCCYLSALLGLGRSKLLEDCLDLDLLLAKYEIFVNDLSLIDMSVFSVSL